MAIGACDKSDLPQPPMAVPKFEAVYADSIDLNSARLNALVSNPGMLTSFGFVIQADGSTQEITLKAQTDIDTIRAWADNLEPQTKYFFWAKADNGGGITITSDTLTFRTLSIPADTTDTPGVSDTINDPVLPDTTVTPNVTETPDSTVTPNVTEIPDTIVTPTDTIDSKSLYLEFESDFLFKWLKLRYDADNDGRIDTIEAKNINTIEINTDNITSLKGIERLHSLTKITAHGTRIGDSVSGKLEHIDLSGNPDLLELHVEHNVLKDIDFSHNTKLTFVELNLNSITQIDVYMLKEVDLLSVEYNLISTFDCSGLDKLRELHVGHCPNLTSITLDNKVLESLDCADDEALIEIDISKCPLLNGIDFWGCKNLKKVIMSRDQAIGSIRTEPDSNIEFIYE